MKVFVPYEFIYSINIWEASPEANHKHGGWQSEVCNSLLGPVSDIQHSSGEETAVYKSIHLGDPTVMELPAGE